MVPVTRKLSAPAAEPARRRYVVFRLSPVNVTRAVKGAWVAGLLSILGFAAPAMQRGEIPKEVADKIEAAVTAAYAAASAKLPCKVGLRSKPTMLRWQDVDKCLSQAALRANWKEVESRLAAVRPPYVSETKFAAAVEASLSRHALPYDKAFLVKKNDALLPLTNSILKYLPADSLMDQPVYDQSRKSIGTFAGTFIHEHAGGMTDASLTLFQFADPQGKIQTPAERLLLDSYGIPWSKAATQPGFRLLSGRLRTAIEK